MNAGIYTGTRAIALKEVERQSVRPGCVVLEMTRSGICGSDLHDYFGHRESERQYATGHEICGVVRQVGEGVRRVQVGDRVVVECFSHCGECVYCRTGQYNHCQERRWFSENAHGGFADYVLAHESSLFKLPDSVSDEEGALIEPLAVAHRALAESGANYQDRVVIIGGGTIGQLCLAVAKAVGVRETLITTKYPQQTALARTLGADHVVQITDADPLAYVQEWSGVLGADVVIETAGGGSNFDAALEMVRRRGRVVLLAVYTQPQEVNLMRIVGKEAYVSGSNCYAYSGLQTDFEAAIELVVSGRVDPTPLVTHRFPLQEIEKAFAVSADKASGAVKVHLLPQSASS